MKKIVFLLVALLLVLSLTACSISTRNYDEIADYVLENQETLSPKRNMAFYTYDASGLAVGGVYYGYYYTAEDEIVIPDFYSGYDLREPYEADGGTYFGKPNNGTDWCYIRKIIDDWYYYELHWG